MKKIKESIKKLMQRSTIFHRLYKKIVYTKRGLTYKRFGKQLPLEEKTILFESFQGRLVTCSPKAMYYAALKSRLLSFI